MKKVTLLGIALICVFAGIYSACDNPVHKLPAVDTNVDTQRSITGNLNEYSEQEYSEPLTANKTEIEKISQGLFGNGSRD